MLFQTLTTQIWLSDKAAITELMNRYESPCVYYGATHYDGANEKPHCHIVLFAPAEKIVSDIYYTNDEGQESLLRWKKLRAENGLIYPFHLKYSKTGDCFNKIDGKAPVNSSQCFGIIKEVPDNWSGYYGWLPMSEDDIIITELDTIASSGELLVYLKKNKRRISRMDCYKVMGMFRIYDVIENNVERRTTNDSSTDETMQNFLDNL